ncbi:MAG: FecR domain-containing protein [Myxococcales bacterium]|nr:FecR domain-containing protein [Myxococcales bacterium]
MRRILALSTLLLAGSALAAVGKIAVLEGAGTRTPKDGGAAVALAVGTEVELGDTIDVSKGNLKLELNDGSVIALAERSKLQITEAEFEGQERKGFSAFLKAGSLWTKVKKALGGGKFEVTTERAVAGVRGTIFRIDADTLVKAAKGKGQGRKASVVRVVEGVVAVRPSKAVAKTIKAATPAAPKGQRVEVPGPKEITADEWEARFVELQKNQQIAVGVDLWEQAEIDAKAKADAFSQWLEKNQ